MIVVTKLNGSQFAINPDLIERITCNPDTTLVMVDGTKYIVTESLHEAIEKITHYRARVVSLTHTMLAADEAPAATTLGTVSRIGAVPKVRK